MDSIPNRNAGHRVAHTAHLWVPLSDGVRLSASLWLPEGAGPCPAVLEIIPYRKRDHTATRDWGIHGFLAQAGFGGVRVDMRGTGDSEGIDDPHQTYADTVEVLAWMQAQPWCDGHMGMIGLSWGGINALKAAEQRPPAGAVGADDVLERATVCASLDQALAGTVFAVAVSARHRSIGPEPLQARAAAPEILALADGGVT